MPLLPYLTVGSHPLAEIDGWHATRATRSYKGPGQYTVSNDTMKFSLKNVEISFVCSYLQHFKYCSMLLTFPKKLICCLITFLENKFGYGDNFEVLRLNLFTKVEADIEKICV